MWDVVEPLEICIPSLLLIWVLSLLIFSLDYINWRKPVPDSCRHPVTGNCYADNCPQALAWWLEPWTSTLAAISLAFCLLDPVVVGVTMRLRSYIT